MDHTLRFSFSLSVHDYQSMDNSSLASALAWIYDWLYGRRLYWISLPGSLHTQERPKILVLRYSLIQAPASPGNTRVAPHQLASDLVVTQKREYSRPQYVSKDIYSAPEQDSQPRLEGHSLEDTLWTPYNLQRTSLSEVVRIFWLAMLSCDEQKKVSWQVAWFWCEIRFMRTQSVLVFHDSSESIDVC